MCLVCSPCLASGQVFQVDLVEVWLLQPPEEEQEEPGSNSSGSKGAGELTVFGVLNPPPIVSQVHEARVECKHRAFSSPWHGPCDKFKVQGVVGHTTP